MDELVDYFTDDRPQLRYFLATCTSFANRARYHIYRAIRIVTQRNLTGFFELCQAAPEIPLLVRALVVESRVFNFESRSAIQLFDVLKFLKTLSIISYAQTRRDEEFIAIARRIPLTTLVFERAYFHPRANEFVCLIRDNAQLKTLCFGHIIGRFPNPLSRIRRPFNPEQRIEVLSLLTSSALDLVLGYPRHPNNSIPDHDANHTLIAVESVQKLVLSFDTLRSARLPILLGLTSNLKEFIISECYPLDPRDYVAYGLRFMDLSRFSIIKAEVSDPRFGVRLVKWLLSCLAFDSAQPSTSTNAPEITIVVLVKVVLQLAWLKKRTLHDVAHVGYQLGGPLVLSDDFRYHHQWRPFERHIDVWTAIEAGH